MNPNRNSCVTDLPTFMGTKCAHVCWCIGVWWWARGGPSRGSQNAWAQCVKRTKKYCWKLIEKQFWLPPLLQGPTLHSSLNLRPLGLCRPRLTASPMFPPQPLPDPAGGRRVTYLCTTVECPWLKPIFSNYCPPGSHFKM